jgi:hypothetical protein
LTVGEAATYLALSHRTAERRLAAARALLGARTSAQAVVVASNAGGLRRVSLETLSARERDVLEGVANGSQAGKSLTS